MLRKTVCSALSLMATMSSGFMYGAPLVSNVTAQPREGTKSVAITYDLTHSEGLVSAVTVEATSNDGYWVALNNVTGDVGLGVTQGTGKSIIWEAGSEWPAQLFTTVKVRVRANDGQAGGDEGPAPEGLSLISAGTFFIGSPESEWERVRKSVEPIDPSDEVLHRVTLTQSFLISKNELTWSEWNIVRDWALSNGYSDLPTGQNGFDGDESGKHPATRMSWYGAVKWLNAKSEMEGLTPCYSIEGTVYRTGDLSPDCNFNANGYRLPTESEWEYACRAGSPDAFYTGEINEPDSVPLDLNLDQAGWYLGNSGSNTHPVGDLQKLDNDFGLRDMHGNVVEWCWDWYGSYPAGDIIDPTGPPSGSKRLKRGGAFAFFAVHCRSAYRSAIPPQQSSNSIGFRLCLSKP